MSSKRGILFAVGLGSFMSALDASVVNTILPVIKEAFKSNITAIEWVVTVYLLVISGLLLTFGRLGDIKGHKTVYVWGFGIFILSSVICGAAPSVPILIIFRSVQAVGGAILASNSPAIITSNFPAERRGQAIGLISMMTYLGLTTGPSLGGWLAQTVGWRSVFYINLPIGSLALILSLVFIPPLKPQESNQKFDLPGAGLFIAGLVTLMLALNQGSEWGWISLSIMSLLFGSILLLTFFTLVEFRSLSPMLDLNLFRNHLFSASTISAVLNYICVYSLTFLMPFYLIQGRTLNPAQAGMILTAQPILMAISAPISGSLSDRIGARIPGMIGMGLLAGGLFILSRLGSSSPFWIILLGLAIAGTGTGTFISPNTSALLGAAPRHRQGIASGVQAEGRNIGMVLGIGLAGAIFSTQMAQSASEGLFRGVDLGFLVAGFIAILGIGMSAIKER